MGKLGCYFILAAVLLSRSPAQEVGSPPDHVQVVSKLAETLLIHKEEPASQKDSDGIRVMGTVVIAITIDKIGKVNHARTLSGPKLLRPLALTTVRKYRYKPYLLNRTPG
jgi:hypothetical protein